MTRETRGEIEVARAARRGGQFRNVVARRRRRRGRHIDKIINYGRACRPSVQRAIATDKDRGDGQLDRYEKWRTHGKQTHVSK